MVFILYLFVYDFGIICKMDLLFKFKIDMYKKRVRMCIVYTPVKLCKNLHFIARVTQNLSKQKCLSFCRDRSFVHLNVVFIIETQNLFNLKWLTHNKDKKEN